MNSFEKNKRCTERAAGWFKVVSVVSCFMSCEPIKESIPRKTLGVDDYPVVTKYTICLYGGKAPLLEGDIRKERGDVMVLNGPARFTWKVTLPEAGEYEVALSYSADTGGSSLEITGSGSTITGTVQKTRGFFFDSDMWYQLNYERIPLDGLLKLSGGENIVSFRLIEPIPKTVMYLRCLELNPVKVKDSIDVEIQKARSARASTDWMVKAGYGVMFHWTSESQPRQGPLKSFPDAVRDFDLDAFVDVVVETGIGYVLITIGHAKSYCPAPMESWERLHPGHTTKRDLIMEMADRLSERGIRLMLYLNSPNLAGMGKVSVQQYLDNHRGVLTEIGGRYGRKISGYWFDSWYQSYEEYPDFSFEEFFQICKIGNPDRTVALNSWLYPVVTEWQDYWAGETNIPGVPPSDRIIHVGAGRGLQYHALLTLEGMWVHSKQAEMEPPRFTAQYLSDYIRASMKNNCAVTINLGIYQDGTIGEKSLVVMQQVRRIIRGK